VLWQHEGYRKLFDGRENSYKWKGVVLAGGKGSRLYPLTRVTNKHLLPVYDRPMVFYPIQTLVDAGIEDIIIVTGGQKFGDFLRLLSNGKDFALHRIHYTYQEGEGALPTRSDSAEPFVEGEKICVILGDNIIENNIIASKEAFEKQPAGAHIILKEVPDPERFGCPEISDGRILENRGETQIAQIQLCGDRPLFLRCDGIR